MLCITDEGLARLRMDDEFNSWLQKIKESYPDRTDEDIENMLVTFIQLNNGNFPGYTPFGQESDTFNQLLQIYNNDGVRAMEVYEHLFDKDFIEEFGNWCGMPFETEGLTQEQIEEQEKKDYEKLSKSIRNGLGEPAVLFVNSVNHLSADSTSAATNKRDRNIPFKIIIENGEARVITGYDGPVQSGSITFMIAKNINNPLDSTEIQIDTEDIAKAYDFESQNKGFTEKRLGLFITQSSRDLYFISKKISEANGKLRANYDKIHSKEEAIAFIRENVQTIQFGTDKDSAFGCIQMIEVPFNNGSAWQVASPEGIFCTQNRYTSSKSNADKVAKMSIINLDKFKAIVDFITDNVLTEKSDSYLSNPIMDYDYNNSRFILKPASVRSQHNIKTEFALTYASMLFKEQADKFNKYLNWAKQVPEINQNSVGVGATKDVNMVGNLIGAILSGQLIDNDYYTAHSFDQSAVEQAVFVSRHTTAIREILNDLWKDVQSDIQTRRMEFIKKDLGVLSNTYKAIDFSNIADNMYKNRTISKIDQYDSANNFCDTIDKVKAAYGYRRNDSGSRKEYDATEYTKISSTFEQLNQLNKQIKEFLINKGDGQSTVSGESVERLISQYFTCIDTIVSIMDDDISRLEFFIWNAPEKYTTEYYQSLLYFDRSVIKMYKEWKTTIEKMFLLDSDSADVIQNSLYGIFSQTQIRRFEELKSRYYNNYEKLSSQKTIHNKNESLESCIDTMINDAVQHICDDWCNKNLKCLTEEEERSYRESLKLDLVGHLKAGMPLDTFIGGASSSGHNIINVLYRIIQTQGNRSNLLIKQKGDALVAKFNDTFGNHNPFNQCKQFCEMVEDESDKKWITRKPRKTTSGYFIRDVNYGQYYRAKVKEQRRLLDKLPKDSDGNPLYYTINEDRSTKTKLFIEWHIGSEEFQNQFLDSMDMWIEKNANRRYNAKYYIDRRRILSKDRVIDGHTIVVGNDAANRQNTLRRQIDGIKNRHVEKIELANGEKINVFIPSKVPPVQKKILDNLEQQLADLSSPYERYVKPDGTPGIREKSGLDLAIALNIQEWNKYVQDKRTYTQNVDLYNKVDEKIKERVGKNLSSEDYDSFVQYYHKTQAKQEYYDALEEMYGGSYGDYQDAIDDIRFRRRSILSRVKYGKKGLLQKMNLDKLTDAEWEELERLDIEESKIKSKLPQQFNNQFSITSSLPVENEATHKSFIQEHKDAGKLHEYIDAQGEYQPLSVYFIHVPNDNSLIDYNVLTDQFVSEESEYSEGVEFDQSNPSYEQPKAYDSTGKKLYKNDDFDKIKNDPNLFDLYNEFLNIMQEANQMFGYAAISSNYKLPQIYENEASVYVGRGCSIANSFVYKFKRSYLIDERDLDRSYTSDMHADNTSSGKLRKRFVEMLSDPEHISTDLVYSVMAYYITACRYSDKQNVQAQCELINRKIAASGNEQLKNQTDSVVETFLFENTMDTSNVAAAAAEKFMQHTTVVMLKWKLKTAIKALIDGYRLLTNVMISDKWNARGHFIKATSRALRQTFTSVRSSYSALDYDLSEALMSLNNINLQSYADVNKTKFTRAFRRSGLLPALTMIDHITTKSIMLTVYDSIRLYTNPDGTKQFLNIDEFINIYKKDHPELSNRQAKKQAKKLFWGKTGNDVVTLYDAYQLGKRDDKGEIIKDTENILSIKDEYLNMFSSNPKENTEQWDILQTRVQGQINQMCASINGFKPEDTKSGTAFRKWFLKPIFQIRSFVVANYNELFKHSNTFVQQNSDEAESENSITRWFDKLKSSDYAIVQTLNRLTSEREMYNVLTGTKDVGYYPGVLSFTRKLIEDVIIYIGSIFTNQKPDLRHITKLEIVSVINLFLVAANAAMFYNTAMYIGGLLACLLGQGSNPDDEDEWFVHWFLWTAYDIAGSMFNDTLVNLPTGDTVIEIFKNIAVEVVALEQFKQSWLRSNGALEFVKAMFGDEEVFEDPEYGTNSNPFNLQKSGKWQREMYGKRYLYETMQNAPWLISPWYTWLVTIPVSAMIPPVAPVNLKESFSSTAARAKASYTFNNLSPIDRFDLKTPSGSEESWDKFHNYKAGSSGAKLLYNLTNEYFGSEDELLEFIRDVGKSPVIPNRNPVDKVERMFPFGREYDE